MNSSNAITRESMKAAGLGCGYTDLELIYLLIENLKPLY